MIRLPSVSTLSDTLFPYTTRCRSRRQGEVGGGSPRFGLIRKTPPPNPSGHRTQLDGVRQAASQWLASGLPYPLPSQGREQSSRIPPLLQSVRRLCWRLLSPPRSHASQHAVAPDQAVKQRRRQVQQERGEQQQREPVVRAAQPGEQGSVVRHDQIGRAQV